MGLAILGVALMLAYGCADGGGSPSATVWPNEIESIQTVDGSPVAVSLSGDDGSFVVADCGVWRSESDGLTPNVLFSGGYMVAGLRPRSADPYIDGAVYIGSNVAVVRRGAVAASDGEGISRVREYEELVLVDVESPSGGLVLFRVEGAIRAVRAHESADGRLKMILVEWSETAGPSSALTLLTENGEGSWRTVWTSLEDDGSAQIVPWAYGIVTGPKPRDVSVSVVGTSDGDTGASLRALRIDSNGESQVVSAEALKGIEGVQYLSDYTRSGVQGLALRAETISGDTGLLLIEDGGTTLEWRGTPGGAPLVVFGDNAGHIGALVDPESPEVGSLRIQSLDGGGTTEISVGSSVTWARVLSPASDGSVRIALVGTGSDGATWSVHLLEAQNIEGPFEFSTPVDSWLSPVRYGGVASLDELLSSDRKTDSLVLGLRLGHEGAVATVPLRAE